MHCLAHEIPPDCVSGYLAEASADRDGHAPRLGVRSRNQPNCPIILILRIGKGSAGWGSAGISPVLGSLDGRGIILSFPMAISVLDLAPKADVVYGMPGAC